MRLYLVCAAESQPEAEGRIPGDQIDEGLSVRGAQQADLLADFFHAEHEKGLRFDRIYTSPLRRARETAERITQTLRRAPAEILPEFRAVRWGQLTGEKGFDAKRQQQTIVEAWVQGEPIASAAEGESARDAWERIRVRLRELTHSHRHDTILLVGHEFLNRLILSRLIYGTFEHADEFPQAHAGFTILDFERMRWYAPVRNQTMHLSKL